MLPAPAFLGGVGVVKSPENSRQWASIRNRLQAAGISYCVVDLSQWQEIGDLSGIRVLILPNVENISGIQVEALESWAKRGGRLIVTGPTGSLSQPEVKEQLRSLFGAYWGYTNSSPSTLKVVETAQFQGSPYSGLSSTLIGGAVIPASINSQTAAVWLSQGKPPAVVLTERATFLGWRWGVDAVASAALDTAWLQLALSRFGINRGNQLTTVAGQSEEPCSRDRQPEPSPFPILPQPLEVNAPPPQPVPVPPALQPAPPTDVPQSTLPATPTPTATVPTWTIEQPSGRLGLSAAQVNTMSQELESLIARVESTLLSAEAAHSAIALPSTVASKAASVSANVTPSPRQSYQAIVEAREGLRQFQQLVNQQEYDAARQLWLKARRTLWDNYPTSRTFAQPEVRAMWLDRGTIVKAASEAELAVIFDRMAQAGINTVFFETLNASYPIYPSRIAPEQNPLTLGWDPLKVAVKLAHARGMELHAWVWIFAAANQGHNRILNQPPDYLGPVLSRYSDWQITDKQGNAFDRGPQFKKVFFDPANPEVQRYLLALLDEIATNYEVDGIHFDYIRYPFQDPKTDQAFGYSKVSRALFQEISGVDPIEISPGHALWSQWTGFRIRQIDSFVATASARLKQKKPQLILSASVFPLEHRDRLFRLQQNWEEWMRQGWVDMIVLMTYALDTGSLEERTESLGDRNLPMSSLVIPGLRLLKVPDPVTIDQIQFVRNMPTGGFALFAAENLTPDLQAIFHRIQAPAEAQPIPYRQPFKAAAARYQALQREWRFLLANHQLALEGANLPGWNQQADSLANALNQLAAQPSAGNLSAARRELTQFRRQFPQWMRQYQGSQPYLVKVWENHLETLNKLLAYGERTVLQEKRNH